MTVMAHLYANNENVKVVVQTSQFVLPAVNVMIAVDDAMLVLLVAYLDCN